MTKKKDRKKKKRKEKKRKLERGVVKRYKKERSDVIGDDVTVVKYSDESLGSTLVFENESE